MENNPIVRFANKKTISELFRYGPANISITLACSPLLSPATLLDSTPALKGLGVER